MHFLISDSFPCFEVGFIICIFISSVHSIMTNSLQHHGLQYTRPPCPSPTPRACSNSHPSSRSCHPTISSSVIPFSSCPNLSPSGSFPMTWLFTSGSQSIGASASASASVLPVNIQGWFSLRLTGLILLSKGLSRVFSSTAQFKSINSTVLSLFYGPTVTSIHDYWQSNCFDLCYKTLVTT